jgi:hypothetical protein
MPPAAASEAACPTTARSAACSLATGCMKLTSDAENDRRLTDAHGL